MTQAFQSIKQGLNEAINHARGDKRGVMVYQPQEVCARSTHAPGPDAGAICSTVWILGSHLAALGAR